MTAMRYISDDVFEEAVRKELNNTASSEDESILWENEDTINRWKKILETMKATAENLVKRWEEEYTQEESKYLNAQIYTLPEWQRYCKEHAKNIRDVKQRILMLNEKIAVIWQYFNDKKENNLLTVVTSHISDEQVQKALQELDTRSAKMLEYQEKRAKYQENWRKGLQHGMYFATLNMGELWKLGFSHEEAEKILKEFVVKEIRPWTTKAEKYDDLLSLPDFRVFLYEKGYFAGPKNEE